MEGEWQFVGVQLQDSDGGDWRERCPDNLFLPGSRWQILASLVRGLKPAANRVVL
jgi:hypothetical protein